MPEKPANQGRDMPAPASGVLSREQNVAMLHIAAGRGAREAAWIARVNRGTVYRWLRDPAFRHELGEARRVACVAARLQMIGLVPEALELAWFAMHCQEIPAAVGILRSMRLLDRLGTAETAMAGETAAPADAELAPAVAGVVDPGSASATPTTRGSTKWQTVAGGANE